MTVMPSYAALIVTAPRSFAPTVSEMSAVADPIGTVTIAGTVVFALEDMSITSVAALSIPWAEVLRRATVEHLLETDAEGRWRAGVDINDAPSAELDSRALVSLSWLESMSGTAAEDAELDTQLGMLRAA